MTDTEIWEAHCKKYSKILTWNPEKQEIAKKAYLAGYKQGEHDFIIGHLNNMRAAYAYEIEEWMKQINQGFFIKK